MLHGHAAPADEAGVAHDAKYWPAADPEPMADEGTANRGEALRRALIRRGWALVLVGALIPPLLVIPMRFGVVLRREGEPQGTMLLWVSAALLVARVALFLS